MNTDITTLDFTAHAEALNAIIDDYNEQSDATEDMTAETRFNMKATDIAWLVHMASASLEYIEKTQTSAHMAKAFAFMDKAKENLDNDESFWGGLKALLDLE